MDGRGVPQDYIEAARWYRLAAEQGDPRAQNDLGVMLAFDFGIKKDLVAAHMWLTLAAARTPAAERERREKTVEARDLVASQLTPKQLARAQALAREWRPKRPGETLN